MRKLAGFRPRAAIAALVLGGVLLAPMASHGCQVRGSSLQEEIPVTGVQAPLEAHTSAVLQWELTHFDN